MGKSLSIQSINPQCMNNRVQAENPHRWTHRPYRHFCFYNRKYFFCPGTLKWKSNPLFVSVLRIKFVVCEDAAHL